jgi:hypothetical protein
MKQIFILSLTCLMIARAEALLCPSNFNHIAVGDNIKTVELKCGKPSKQESKLIPPPTPQEWTYYIPQTVSTGSSNAQQGTLKTTISFDANGNAINISVNGIGVGASTICGNSINLGDNIKSVQAACGKPAVVNQTPANTSGNVKQDEQTTYIYNTNPPTTFTFKNGVLIDSADAK